MTSQLKQLKQQVEVFEQSHQYSVSGTWKWMFDSNEIYWSDNIFKLLGYAPNEINPNYELFVNSIHPDDKERTLATIQDCLENNKPYELRHRIISRDGTVNWFQERGGIVHDDNGEPLYMTGVGYIVNKEVKLEREREQLVEKLQSAIAEIKELRELISICSYCHNIRSDDGSWDKLEAYLAKHMDVKFSHGVCPSCAEKVKDDFGLN
ncbi:MAG: PAS domain-containing protein [Kangiellaceae bacterium]|nr:PAS domain-containing protein [Kangiellaceae bacterium]